MLSLNYVDHPSTLGGILRRWMEATPITRHFEGEAALTQSGLKPPELTRRLLTLPGVKNVWLDGFRMLLQRALEKDPIRKSEDGDLIVGLDSELA